MHNILVQFRITKQRILFRTITLSLFSKILMNAATPAPVTTTLTAIILLGVLNVHAWKDIVEMVLNAQVVIVYEIFS